MANLVVGSKVKESIKSKGCHTSGDLTDALDKKMEAILDGACKRCQSNKRTTVKPHDL